MNRHDRRAAEAQSRKPLSRADLINLASGFLAASGHTATGMTVIHRDGTATYLSRETADTMVRTTESKGVAQ